MTHTVADLQRALSQLHSDYEVWIDETCGHQPIRSISVDSQARRMCVSADAWRGTQLEREANAALRHEEASA